jgi:hypothetical protein
MLPGFLIEHFRNICAITNSENLHLCFEEKQNGSNLNVLTNIKFRCCVLLI